MSSDRDYSRERAIEEGIKKFWVNNGMTPKVAHLLWVMGIYDVPTLAATPEIDFMRVPGMGKVSIDLIKCLLNRYHLNLLALKVAKRLRDYADREVQSGHKLRGAAKMRHQERVAMMAYLIRYLEALNEDYTPAPNVEADTK